MLNVKKLKLFEINVNNKIRKVEVDPSTPLLWVLRDNLNLVGTKYGCGISQCGACTIHLNGEAIRSCVYPISAVGKQKITTIEGLSKEGELSYVQEAWINEDVSQCGYCQAGQIMTAGALRAWAAPAIAALGAILPLRPRPPSTRCSAGRQHRGAETEVR